MGFGFGSGYKDLVFVISPKLAHVNPGIVKGAALDDPNGLLEARGKVHGHLKLRQVEQVQDPALEQLVQTALLAAQQRFKKVS